MQDARKLYMSPRKRMKCTLKSRSRVKRVYPSSYRQSEGVMVKKTRRKQEVDELTLQSSHLLGPGTTNLDRCSINNTGYQRPDVLSLARE